MQPNSKHFLFINTEENCLLLVHSPFLFKKIKLGLLFMLKITIRIKTIHTWFAISNIYDTIFNWCACLQCSVQLALLFPFIRVMRLSHTVSCEKNLTHFRRQATQPSKLLYVSSSLIGKCQNNGITRELDMVLLGWLAGWLVGWLASSLVDWRSVYP